LTDLQFIDKLVDRLTVNEKQESSLFHVVVGVSNEAVEFVAKFLIIVFYLQQLSEIMTKRTVRILYS